MNEIICPNCHKAFEIDDTSYAEILKQVRDHQFEDELQKRLELAENEKNNALKLTETSLKAAFQEELNKKETEITRLRALSAQELTEQLSKKENEIIQLRAKFEKTEVEKELAITEATRALEKERDDLANKLKSDKLEKDLLINSLNEKHASEIKTKDDIIKMREEEIAYRKDMKQRLSTKMLGESLEQHCEIEFNKLRATAFQNAYFEKDNDISAGSKGDYIFRESDDSGNEIVSIMFEMKNEGDETATK